MTSEAKQRRWYDKDPLLSMAMKTLEQSSDENQIRLAMHMAKMISEHSIDAAEAVRSMEERDGDGATSASLESNHIRWYDLDRTLKTSVEMLRCCPADLQRDIAREIAQVLRDFMMQGEGTETA